LGHQSSPDDFATEASNESLAAIVGARISANEAAFIWLLNEIGQEGWFVRPDPLPGYPAFRLTMKGWTFYEELRHRAIMSRTAFMAMQFDVDTLQTVFETCFKPAVTAAGFELRLVTDAQGAGLIDNQIRAAIRSAKFKIAPI
jgi:hypothetical protein